jgi:hypothetical protein
MISTSTLMRTIPRLSRSKRGKGEVWRVLGLINGYLRYLRDRKADGGSVVREGRVNPPEDDEAWVLLNEALSAAGPF